MRSGATLKELANAYSVSINTFKKWIWPYKKDLMKINNNTSKRYTPAQIEFIVEKLGEPTGPNTSQDE